MAIAEKFGVLPDTVENEMSEYWIDRVAVQMEAKALDDQRRERERQRRSKRR